MSQRANSKRNATLDQKKQRSAGRQSSLGRHELNRDDFDSYKPGDKQIGGAFGKVPPRPTRRGGRGK